ncbi:hypothetical protein NKJ10_30575 [Mesorhizobium sp. M0204]|uniref:hypothetical protein n=1 Tax=Mesorhizobium sp. M0204 TaxID=2956913 RepID=UPI00333AF5B7
MRTGPRTIMPLPLALSAISVGSFESLPKTNSLRDDQRARLRVDNQGNTKSHRCRRASQEHGALGKAILTSPALMIVGTLVDGRLADLDEGAALGGQT